MPERVSEIAIQFKQVPSLLFRQSSIEQLTPNFLVLRIQPNEGITLHFGAKVPGPSLQMGAVGMDFCYYRLLSQHAYYWLRNSDL